MQNPEGISFFHLTTEQKAAIEQYCKNDCAVLFPEQGPCATCAQKAMDHPRQQAVTYAHSMLLRAAEALEHVVGARGIGTGCKDAAAKLEQAFPA